MADEILLLDVLQEWYDRATDGYREGVSQCPVCLWIPGSDWRGPHGEGEWDCALTKTRRLLGKEGSS